MEMKLRRAIKAFELSNDPPYRGDIRPTRDYPAGTKLSQITEFEVWDGESWVSPQQEPAYQISGTFRRFRFGRSQ